MKIEKILNISAGLALMCGAAACSSDYLDLKPEGTLQYDQAIDNEEGATLAITGLCSSMYTQYAGISDGSLGFNGEPELLMYYGEVMGQDYVSTYWMAYGSTYTLNWDTNATGLMNNANGSQPAWGYCYSLISQANNIITFAPKVLDDEGNVVKAPEYNNNPVPDVSGRYAFRYAQALTFRAHAYIHLMQIYCARWENRKTSEDEWTLTVPLRLEYQSPESDLNCPLAKWNVLMDQIYADLRQAIALYEKSQYYRDFLWEPDESVAKGLLARAAMINHDWKTARQMAREARANYELMSSDEYQMGFAEANSEWMWTNSGEAQGIYFYSFGAMYACNGAYPCRWGTIGAGGINQDLIKETETRDQRANLYFAPRNVLGNLKLRFWDNSYCNSQTMNINAYERGDLHQEFVKFCTNRYRRVEDKGWDPPYTFYNNPPLPIMTETTMVTATFGAQFKFWGTDAYSTSYFPFMRASEMILTEAEAAWEDGDYQAADDLLYELNSKRITNYSKTYTGEELLAKIKHSRRMELWGEGFNWFDYKRWNEPIVRTAWRTGDTESGNWPDIFAKTMPVSVSNGWRWRIPVTELQYNKDIDQAQASYGYDW